MTRCSIHHVGRNRVHRCTDSTRHSPACHPMHKTNCALSDLLLLSLYMYFIYSLWRERCAWRSAPDHTLTKTDQTSYNSKEWDSLFRVFSLSNGERDLDNRDHLHEVRPLPLPLPRQPRRGAPTPVRAGAQFNWISTDFSKEFSTEFLVPQGVPHYNKNSVEKSVEKSVEISTKLLNWPPGS